MPTDNPLFLRLVPILFVLIWSTGWIVARAAAPYADPLTFLAVRYAAATACIVVFALVVRAQWPATPGDIGHSLVCGVLIHAIYLGSVWWAIAQGLPAGISALIAALQPIFTAMLAPILLGERITARQWLGIALGFVGIVLVLAPKLAGLEPAMLRIALVPIVINAIGMASVTLGTFYQKRFVRTADLRTTTAIQYIGAFLVTLPVAMAIEDMRIEWNLTVLAVLAWSVLALSIGAIGLLLILIRRGAVSKAAALVYLVPPTVAVQTFLMFGETLSPVQIAGMVVTPLGVWLATRAA